MKELHLSFPAYLCMIFACVFLLAWTCKLLRLIVPALYWALGEFVSGMTDACIVVLTWNFEKHSRPANKETGWYIGGGVVMTFMILMAIGFTAIFAYEEGFRLLTAG
jgi:hypothetical protein